jgi:hypothetical protein
MGLGRGISETKPSVLFFSLDIWLTRNTRLGVRNNEASGNAAKPRAEP